MIVPLLHGRATRSHTTPINIPPPTTLFGAYLQCVNIIYIGV